MDNGNLFGLDEYRTVVIAASTARLPFHGCDPDYIRDTCHAACCRAPSRPNGILVTIHPSEQSVIEAAGGTVTGGLLKATPERRCPFQGPEHLCALHETPAKPFGCIASPFTLSPSGGRLIVRNRYKLLRCYNDGSPPLPAYRAFGASLVLLFGSACAARITTHFDTGTDRDIESRMPAAKWHILRDNDHIKRADH